MVFKKQHRKGLTGTAVEYMTRNRALKKLQITPVDFRHLCILKGIYPKDPKHKSKIPGGAKPFATLYHIKDIHHLMHEPILEKFRAYKAFSKKMKRFIGRKEWSLAKKFAQNRPVYSLSNVLKERYPTFVDVLRDLDDALCHVSLFAILPKLQHTIQQDNPLAIFVESASQQCAQLRNEFLHYVMHKNALRKAFISIKGIYFQAEVCGQTITWLMPFEFHHPVPDVVDMRVMFAYLELYQQQLTFVNYKLYVDEGLAYPPPTDPKLEISGASLMAIAPIAATETKTPQGEAHSISIAPAHGHDTQALGKGIALAMAAQQNESESIEPVVSIEQEDLEELDSSDEARLIREKAIQEVKFKSLFRDCVFYLSREVPCDPLVLIIRSFGGRVGWEHFRGSPYIESDSIITHHIVDRPVQEQVYMHRVYIQPQWVFDCINQLTLIPPQMYGPGTELPPHLSPFVLIEDNSEVTMPSIAIPTVEESELHLQKLIEADTYTRDLDETIPAVNDNVKHEATPKKKNPNNVQYTEREENAMSVMSKKKRKLYQSMRRDLVQKQAQAKATSKSKLQSNK